jgi:catechol 2,3-dioxygenase-like lactoylglutathione lyase family enzyme
VSAAADGVWLSGVVLSSSDPRRLADFYRRLLHLEADQESETWVSLKTQGGVRLSFQSDEQYHPPVWPTQQGQQQMMLHIDFDVSDLADACDHALRAGARLAEFQPQPDARVFLDPDGHPFCFAQKD